MSERGGELDKRFAGLRAFWRRLGGVLEVLEGVLEALGSILDGLDGVLEAMLYQDSTKMTNKSTNM